MPSNRERGAHPAGEALIRYLDGELSLLAARKVRNHLESCWACRHRADQMSRTMLRLVESTNELIEAAGCPLPDPEAFSRSLPQRAPRSAPAPPRANLLRFGAALGWVGGVAGVFLLAMVVLRQPPASAASILAEAESREQARLSVPNLAVRQRVSVEKGEERAEWEVWHLPHQRRRVARWEHSGDLRREIEDVCRDLGCGTAPLSASGFADWRGRLPRPEDRVERSEQFIEIQTTDSAQTQRVREATLRLRAEDFHAVGQELTVVSAEGELERYKIAELNFEVLPEAQALAILSPPPPPPDLPFEGPRTIELPAPPEPAPDLDVAEVILRRAIHDLNYDVRFVPEIERGEREVTVRMMTPSVEEREAAIAALAQLGGVRAEVGDPENPVALAAATAGELPSYEPEVRTEPPFRERLAEELGGPAEAVRLGREVHRLLRQMIREALALDRLGERYPAPAFADLPAEARATLDAIAADHLRKIRRHWPQASREISLAFHAVRRSPPPEAPLVEESCLGWQQAGARVSAALRDLEAVFDALFVEQEGAAVILADPYLEIDRGGELIHAIDATLGEDCGP